MSEASPTLGCSIEILRDIYMCRSAVCLKETLQKIQIRGRNYVAQKRACSKSAWGGKQTCDTLIIHFYYTLEQL